MCSKSCQADETEKCNAAMDLRTLVKGLCMQYGILPGEKEKETER